MSGGQTTIGSSMFAFLLCSTLGKRPTRGAACRLNVQLNQWTLREDVRKVLENMQEGFLVSVLMDNPTHHISPCCLGSFLVFIRH